MSAERRRVGPRLPSNARDAILQKAAHVLKLDHDEIAREWLESLARPDGGRQRIPEEILGDVQVLIQGVADVLLEAKAYRAFLGKGEERAVAHRLAGAHQRKGNSLTDSLVAYMRLRQRLIRASSGVFRESDQPFFELMARINRCVDRVLFAVAESYFAAFQEELERQALTDPLTGLGNSRRFHEALRGELKRSDRSGRPFSIIFVDVDDFKDLNDRFGHLAADRVLVSVAEVIREQLRESDLVCRWGGDEFIVILPDTDRKEATVVAEKLRAAVPAAETCQGVTISLGVACCPEDGKDYDALVNNADGALYVSKQSGKNTVTASTASTQRELRL